MKDILLWIIFGGIAGWMANFIVGGENKGCLLNIVIGVAGSVIGGLIFQYFGKQGWTGFDLYSLLVAVVGSIVLVVIVNLLKK